MPMRKGFCPDCGCRVHDPLPRDPDFFAICVDCGPRAIARAAETAREKAKEREEDHD